MGIYFPQILLYSHASIIEFCIHFNAIILVPTAFGRVYPISIILISRVLGLCICTTLEHVGSIVYEKPETARDRMRKMLLT